MSGTPDSRTGDTTREFFRNRTEDGWDGFVEHYGRTIYRWCRGRWRLGVQDAEDLTQLVVVKLFEKMKAGAALWDPEKGRFHAWLTTVVRNACFDAREERPLEVLENDAACEDFVAELVRKELREVAMANTRTRVSDKEWEVFRLRTFEGRSAKEVAEQGQLTVATVNNYTSKVRGILKEELDQLAGVE